MATTDLLTADVWWQLGLLALVLLYFWSLNRKWSKIPPRPKPPRRPLTDAEEAHRLRRLLLWWLLWST